MSIPRPLKRLLGRRIDEAALAATWRRVRERRQSRRRARTLGVAASTAALALIAIVAWQRRTPAPLRFADRESIGVMDARVQPRELPISDGSRITLSPGARLDAVDNEAGVFATTLLRGRAEFEVRPGGRRRWLVHAGNVTVEVVGTHFIVDRAAHRVWVRVTRGEVMVRGERVDGGARRLRIGESLSVETTAAPEPAAAPATEPERAPPLVDPAPPQLEAPPPEAHQIVLQRRAGADPHLPDAVKRSLRGRADTAFAARICVARSGAVSDVTVLQGIAGADERLRATLLEWRYDPQPIPVCFVTQLIFSVQ